MKEQIIDEIQSRLDTLREEHGVHSMLIAGDDEKTITILNGKGEDLAESIATAIDQTESIRAMVAAVIMTRIL